MPDKSIKKGINYNYRTNHKTIRPQQIEKQLVEVFSGGEYRSRTGDLLPARQAL